MSSEKLPKPDWFDRIIKLLIPIVGSLLVASLAWWGNTAITEYSSRQENARLITQLQIQREQAESDLRKDIFQQAIGSLLSEDELKSSSLPISKRLLKLELLAENFGGSLSITPLFTEFNRDLENEEKKAGDDFNKKAQIRSYRKRLRGTARRLASDQLSALAQQGTIFEIKVPLKPGGKRFASAKSATGSNDDEGYTMEYKWPQDEAAFLLRKLEGTSVYEERLDNEKRKKGVRSLNGIERHVSATLGKLEPQQRAVSVTLEICWNPKEKKTKFECDDSRDKSVSRTFTLDYFNFPKINNTRLSDNQRFSIVLEEFEPDAGEHGSSFLEIAAVIFPAEYSSLRDRPSMQESVNLLNKVLSEQDPHEEEEEEGDASKN